ncbi:uncharacterized protein TrAtP1_009471 [Trichoderma atroviride]|uniref:uncharacterized protein n=1 Tax=Hypocrea atroviridis TaxID=63577 RepID=UPI0033284D75|nr:hypothetical protein TrAtP1_009471 [Trichoderma atroviride]
MSYLEEKPLGWNECETFVRNQIQKVNGALTSNAAIAVADTHPIRSLEVTMRGYPPLVNPRPGARNYPTGRIEDIEGVSQEFRLAVTLEHAISLIVSDLIRQHYDDGNLVRRVNEKAVDIRAAWRILAILKTWVFSHQQQFIRYGCKYGAVRRRCHEFYLLWHDAQTQVPREVDLETYAMEDSVVRYLGLRLTQLRKSIQTGDLSPGV